jgi:hypothetical protein
VAIGVGAVGLDAFSGVENVMPNDIKRQAPTKAVKS